MKSFTKHLLKLTPYKIIRRSREIRFSATDQAMLSLGERGFDPSFILDGGANVGEFSKLSVQLFQ